MFFITIGDYEKDNSIRIYPNPGNGLFTINLNFAKPDNITIDIYNILGENILPDPIVFDKEQVILDLRPQENGIYFVQIKNGSTLITKKIAVQH